MKQFIELKKIHGINKIIHPQGRIIIDKNFNPLITNLPIHISDVILLINIIKNNYSKFIVFGKFKLTIKHNTLVISKNNNLKLIEDIKLYSFIKNVNEFFTMDIINNFESNTHINDFMSFLVFNKKWCKIIIKGNKTKYIKMKGF